MLIADTMHLHPFKVAANNVNARWGNHDLGLSKGKLFTTAAIDCLKINIPKMFHNDEIPITSLTAYEVLIICKDIKWQPSCSWVGSSAKAFVDICLEQNLGIFIK